MAKAAVTRSIRDDHQKNFLKIFNSLTGKHSRWEIWEDFVTLTAIEISNSTDKVNAPERTKTYQTIICLIFCHLPIGLSSLIYMYSKLPSGP